MEIPKIETFESCKSGKYVFTIFRSKLLVNYRFLIFYQHGREWRFWALGEPGIKQEEVHVIQSLKYEGTQHYISVLAYFRSLCSEAGMQKSLQNYSNNRSRRSLTSNGT